MSTAVAAVEGAREAAVARVVAYIAEHPADPHTLQDLAELAAMNKRTFAQIFCALMGMGPTSYIRAMRVGYAKRLLDETDLPVAQVMRLSGFPNSDTGRRAFLQIEQITPMRYRDQAQALAED